MVKSLLAGTGDLEIKGFDPLVISSSSLVIVNMMAIEGLHGR